MELLVVEGLGVWVCRSERPHAGVDAVRLHNSVVESAITETVTPVPLRFGQWVSDEAALRTALGEKASWYQERLSEFAGKLEFGLRVIDPGVPGNARVSRAAGASGREYMQSLRDSIRLADRKRAGEAAVRTRIQEHMKDLVRAEREEEPRTPHAVLTLMHLVARIDFDEYRERAQELRQLLPDLRFLLSGPWAPYSFAA